MTILLGKGCSRPPGWAGRAEKLPGDSREEPSPLNAAWLRFPSSAPAFCGCKNQIIQCCYICWVPRRKAGGTHRLFRGDRGKLTVQHKLTGPSSSTGKSQEPSRTVGANTKPASSSKHETRLPSLGRWDWKRSEQERAALGEWDREEQDREEQD